MASIAAAAMCGALGHGLLSQRNLYSINLYEDHDPPPTLNLYVYRWLGGGAITVQNAR